MRTLSATAGPRFKSPGGVSQIREFNCTVVAAVGLGRRWLGPASDKRSRLIMFGTIRFHKVSMAKHRINGS